MGGGRTPEVFLCLFPSPSGDVPSGPSGADGPASRATTSPRGRVGQASFFFIPEDLGGIHGPNLPRRIPELKETRAWVPARSTGQKDLGGVPPNPQRGGPAPPWLGRGDLPPLGKRPAAGSPRGPWAGPRSPRGAAPPAGGRPVRGRWAARVWTSMAMDGAMGMGGDPKSADGGGVDNVTTRNGNTGNKTKHRKQKEQK